jgi:hypothetical protein
MADGVSSEGNARRVPRPINFGSESAPNDFALNLDGAEWLTQQVPRLVSSKALD